MRSRLGFALLSLVLVPLHTFWLIKLETELGCFGFNSTDVSLFYSPVSALFLLAAANLFLKRIKPSWAFKPAEFVLLYAMLSVSAAFCGSDLLQNLTPVLVHPFWFATPENGWANTFHHLIPSWFAPRDLNVLRRYYTGSGTVDTAELIRAWLVPCLVWGSFLIVISIMMLCMSAILRKQWADGEKLSFPIIQLPLEITRSGSLDRLFRSKALLIGCLLPIVIESINVTNSLAPSVPRIPLGLYNIGAYFTQPPWNALSWWPPLFISFFPFGIGLTFFLPLDLSFSSWFFYLARRFAEVGANALGWYGASAPTGLSRFPFIREQASGGWIALFILTVWAGRHHLYSAVKSAFAKGTAPDEGEAIRYRWAVWGLIAGMVYLLAFSMAAGMAGWVALLFFTLYFVLTVTMTRIRVQLGPPALELFFVNPEHLLVTFTGTRIMSGGSLTVLSYYFWFNRCYRCQPMAHQLESLQMAKTVGAHLPSVAFWMVLATVVGIASGIVATLLLYNSVGQASAKIMTYRTGVGWEAFNRLNDWLQNPRGPDALGITVCFAAALFGLLLGSLRNQFVAFPLHPIGYAFSTCYAMEYFWFLFLITWLVKLLVVRYGGMRLYRQAMPFFMGLVLGDCIAAFFWAMVGWAFGWHGCARY